MATDEVEDIYGLSPMQAGMLFHTLLAGEQTVYIDQSVFELRGDLNTAAFEGAWRYLMERHAVLRTSFHWEGLEEPLQVAHSAADLPLEYQDWRHLSAEELTPALSAFLRDDRTRGVDPEQAPLMRLTLIRTGATLWRLVWTIHHLLLDGWSTNRVFTEFKIAYESIRSGTRIPLAPLRPYRDYIRWIRQQDPEEAETYWRTRMAGFPGPTALPIDQGPGGLTDKSQFARRSVLLPEANTEALRSLARRHRLTLSTFVQGAWALLLSRYSGEADVVFGTTVSGRPTSLSGVEAMVGLFINTLPVRVRIDGSVRLVDWLRQIQADTAEMREYEHSSLIQIQGWSDVPRGLPLFETLVVVQNVQGAEGAAETSGTTVESPGVTPPGETLQVRATGNETSVNFPLYLVAVPDRRLLLRLHYDATRYHEETIARLLGHLQTLLEGMAADPEGPLSHLPLLTDAEKHQLLVAWNAPALPPQATVTTLFEEQVARTPNAVAVVYEGQQLTYTQLNQRANQLAHSLHKHGVTHATHVGICMQRSLEMIVALLAILKAGAAYLPLDPANPQERLLAILAQVRPPLLLTQHSLVERFEGAGCPCLCREEEAFQATAESVEAPPRTTTAEDLAYVIFTSGSTGIPKGVAVAHRGIVRLVQGTDYCSFGAEEVILQFAPLAFDASTFEIWGSLLNGGRLVLFAGETPSLEELGEVLLEQQITTLWLTAGLFHAMVEYRLEALSGLRQLLAGGDVLSGVHVARAVAGLPGCRLINGYGPTENTTFTCCYEVPSDYSGSGSVPIGRPISNTQVYLLDGGMQPVAIGIAGELYTGGAGLAQGYLEEAVLTAGRFVPDPFSGEAGARLYRTGDLCRYLPDGNIEYLGRLDHQVKIRGFRIELGEIESVLLQHPGVRDTVVVAREDVPGDKRLVAYVQGDPATLSVTTLREYVRAKLPDYMVPATFVFLDTFPLTPNGKIDRRALPAPEIHGLMDAETYVAPRTPIEEGLAQIWSEVLSQETVSIHDIFFDLGGHSLLATQVISRIRNTFQIELPLRALFEAPTVAGLAERIGLARGDESALAPPLVPVSREQTLPLSFSQQRLWFLDQLDPGSSVYNISMALRLTGTLHVSAMERSLEEIVSRHEALRTIFTIEAGVASQVIGEAAQTLALVDLTGMPSEARRQEARRLVQAEAQRPFDLAQGPLFRSMLLRLGEEEHMLLLTMHHIVSDGWSMGVLRRELTALYNAFIAGKPSPLAPLPLQYADYAVWQRDWLQGEVLARHIDYWKGHLEGAPALLELPTDRPRPPLQTFGGALIRLELSAEITQGLKGLGQQEGATLFMTLLAAFQVLLWRYSGQDQIVVGSPIANRTRSEVEGLIGFFVNTLALRGDLSGDPSFVELLGRVREAALGAYAHQDLPFEKLVDALSPERSLSHSPIFQVGFVLQNAGRGAHDFQGLKLSSLASETVTAKFDLQLALTEVNGQVRGSVEYNTDLFDAETIERFTSHFQTLLEAIVDDPEQKLSRLPLLEAPERQKLLVEWNARGGSYPQEPGLHVRFEHQVERTPDAIALVYEAQQLTYAQLNRRANQVAHALRAQGVGADALVGLCVERSLEMVVGVLGILKAGGAYVPLDPSYPTERLAYMLQDAQLSLVLTRQSEIASLPASKVRLLCLDESEELAAQSDWNLPSLTRPEHLAYIIYTSGSTGRPKGVQITHANVVRLMTATADWFHFDARDVWTLFHSLAFDFSVWELWGPLLYGGKLVVVPFWISRSPEAFCALLQQEGVTILNQTPSAFRPLLQILPSDAAQALAIRHVIFGGEALEPATLARWYELYGHEDARLINMYGITETTVHVTFRPMSYADVVAGHGSPIGCPIPDGPLYLLGAGMQPAPIGVAGEIYVSGAGLARGYLGRAELTAERFVPDPFSGVAGARLYRSGDLGRYLASGELEYLGRADDQVKIRGFRIELGEIENALLQHPAVKEAIVVAREDMPGVKRLAAYVVGDASGALSANALREHLLQTLPEYMVPAAFVFLESLPLTSNGKIDRKALPAPDTARPDDEGSYEAPRTPVQEALVQIWRAVLRLERVGIHDNFFELGGDSILSIQIIARANAAGLQLTPRQVFQHQTIAGLAEVAGSEEAIVGEQGVIEGPVPLTPIQRWFFERELADPHHYNQARLLQLDPSVSASQIEQVVLALVAYHDALRMRFLRSETGWEQTNADREDNSLLTRVDLSEISEEDKRAALTRACSQWQASLDLNTGPLLRAVYFEMGEGRSARLLLAIHHLVVDGVSWRILLGDLEAGLEQLGRGESVTFAPKTTSYQHWAQRLEAYAGAETLLAEQDYWLSVRTSDVCDLPVDHPEGANTSASERAVRVSLNEEETRALLSSVPVVYKTQINDVLLTGLAQALCAWTGERAVLVDLEGHGREALFPEVDLSRTVGWFTSLYPVRLALASPQNTGESLKDVKEQLRRIPQRGIGYGVLRYLGSDAEVRRSLMRVPAAQVSFNYHGQVDPGSGSAGLIEPARGESPGSLHSPRSQRSHLLDVVGQVVQGRLQVTWLFSEKIYERSTVENVAADFVMALRGILAHCQSPEAGGFTPSDFPTARLSRQALDRLLNSMGTTGKAGIEDIYPLSPMQSGMLFRTVYVTEHAVYLDQHLHTLQGDLNRKAFQEAWQYLMERHTILRTSFHWEGLEEPLQVVHDRVELPVDYHDLSELPRAERRAALQALVQADRARGVDISRPPLMRVTLIRLEPTTYRLIWTIHHLLLDRWSTSQVMHEWNTAYQALCEEQKVELPALRPYGDFIGWLQKQSPDRAEAYWRRVLGGLASPTLLPIDRAPGSASSPDLPVRAHVQLSEAASTTLQALARRHRLTFSTVIQGAWALLLSRYSGEEDVLFGATVSGRPASLVGVESMVGMFINSLPVRVRTPGSARLLDWLQSLQEEMLELREYEYSALVQIQNWSDLPRGAPLFESLVIVQNTPTAIVESEAGETPEVRPLPTDRLQVQSAGAVSSVDFPLYLMTAPGRIVGLEISYDTHRFDGKDIHRLLEHLKTLLEEMASDPYRSLRSLPMLSEAERHLALVERNAVTAPYPPTCVHQLFEQQVARTPDAVAVVSGEQQLTYAQLNARANRLAHYLRARGVGANVLVGLCVERSLEMIVGVLGILKAGGAYVPLDPSYPPERLAQMLQDAKTPLLLTQQALQAELPSHAGETICLDGDWDRIQQMPAGNPQAGVGPDNLVYVIYTSGSTGKPKGTAVFHRGFSNLVHWFVAEFDFVSTDRSLLLTSISFDLTQKNLFAALSVGGQLHLAPSGPYDPEVIAAAIGACGATHLNCTPSHFYPLVSDVGEVGYRRLSSLRYVYLGGEPIDLTQLTPWLDHPLCHARLVNTYGPTECSDIAAYSILSEIETGGADPGFQEDRTLPIGRPIPNVTLYVLDRYQTPVPDGVVGELYIGGTGVGYGYVGHPDWTAEKFLPDPFSSAPGARLYRTGDLCRYLPDGNIEYLGRIDHQVKIRGFRIELGEIESVLAQHPGVREAIVMAREDTPGDKRLVAYVVGSDVGLTPAALREDLQARLPSYMVPATFVVLEALPLSPNGKVDRKALPAPEVQEPGESYHAPRTPIEKGIAGIWSEVLRRQQISIHDSFFDLGGHSLLATQVISRIRSTFQVELPLRALFETPTVGELAQQVLQTLRSGHEVQAPPLMRVPRTGVLPLSFAQQRLWFTYRLDPDSAAYNMAIALQIRGELDREVLRRALEAIAARHETLRTNFRDDRGDPEQILSEDPTVPLTYVSASGETEAEREQEARDLCREESIRPFDLTRDRLIRGYLVRIEPENHLLTLTMHHIVSDGWSNGILVRELSALYNAFAAGKPSPLAELPLQYADYAVWQREWLQGEELERQIAYWKSQMAGAPPLLQLPTDRARQIGGSKQGAFEQFVIPAEINSRLHRLGQEERATQFMLLLAIFNVLLSSYSDQQDIVVGTDDSGRNHHLLEGIIGFFINHLVMRTDLSGNPTFRELVQRVREMSLGAYAHQDLPFDKLIEVLRPDRKADYSPLFQVLFVMDTTTPGTRFDKSLRVSGVNLGQATPKYDIVLFVSDQPTGLMTSWGYRTDLFDAATIQGMAAAFDAVARAVVETPEITVAELKVMLLDLTAGRTASQTDERRQANRSRLRSALSRHER